MPECGKKRTVPDMDLEEFVETTLLQVMGAVKSAQQKWGPEMQGGGVINPAWGEDDYRNRIQTIDFDVAVTAGTKVEGETGAKAGFLQVVNASAKGAGSIENSAVSRVSFSVPVLMAPVRVDPSEDGQSDN